MSTVLPPWRGDATGITVTVRLTPKSSRDALEDVETRDDRRAVLRARVRAAPEDGKANQALAKLLAEVAGVAARAVALKSGGKNRTKIFHLDGDPDALEKSFRARFPD